MRLFKNKARLTVKRPLYIRLFRITLVILLLPLIPYAISYFEQNHLSHDDKEHIVFSNYGSLRDHEVIALIYSRLSNPLAIVTLLSHNANPEPSVSALLRKWDIQHVAYDIFTQTPMHKKFRRHYLHSSVHPLTLPIGFDYFAQARFLSLYHYMSTEHVHSALFFDTDIVLFTDVLFSAIKKDSTLTHFSDYATHWTLASATEFANFIISFYQRVDVRAIASDMVKFGQRDPDLAPLLDESPLINDWWPPDIPRHHFSDMHLFGAYLAHSNMLTILCEKSCSTALQPLINLHYSSPCNNISDIQNAFEWKSANGAKYSVPIEKTEKKNAVPALHFQGECKSLVAPLLCNTVADLNGKFC